MKEEAVGFNDDDIAPILKDVDILVQVVALLSAFVVTIVTFIVIILSVKRGNWKDLPIKARICLVSFAWYAPSSTLFFAWHLIDKANWDNEMSNTVPRIESSVGTVIWFCMHW